jgi:hypothetical protein
MVVPPRKRKQVQTMNTTSCAIGQLWIHSFLRIYTGKICRKLSQLGFWGVWKGRKTPLPTNHCWYRIFCYFLFFCSNLHSFSLSSGFEKKATFWAPQTTIALRLCAWFFWGCR